MIGVHTPAVSCLRSHDWKSVRSTDRSELFELPNEETDRLEEFPELTTEFGEALDAHRPGDRFDPRSKSS
jgi:hypothetical protein